MKLVIYKRTTNLILNLKTQDSQNNLDKYVANSYE